MNYIAIIGDIMGSRKLEDRKYVQKKLLDTLNEINSQYEHVIAAKFLITLGDEFQGLLYVSDQTVTIMKEIQFKMHPVKIRFGVGIGTITTEINPDAAIGADGPAFYAARSAIESVKKEEKTLKRQSTDAIVAYGTGSNEELEEINCIFRYMKMINDSWSEPERKTIEDMSTHHDGQEKSAKRLGVSQSTVARRLQNSYYQNYLTAEAIVNRAVCKAGETR